MSKNILLFDTPFFVQGSGDSLWYNPDVSNKTFKVEGYIFNNFLNGKEPYELQLFGPNTVWEQYSDKGIARGVKSELMPWVQGLYPEYTITDIFWSEQGMQPDKGWSFDIICKKKEM